MIKKVGLVGFGQMGSGIGQVSAAAGYEVVACEVTDDAFATGMKYITKSLDKMLEKGKIDQAYKDKVLNNISGSTDLGSLADCDIIVEAVVENPKVKDAVLRETEDAVREDAILTSNTSPPHIYP